MVAATLALSACETSAPASPQDPTGPEFLKVAFVKDLSVPDADEHALPAVQAARLAFETASTNDPNRTPVELQEFDLQQDRADLEVIETDPAYVGVIVGPGVDETAAPLDADLPVVSLSGLGAGAGRQAWIRLVAPLSTVADALATRLREAHPCVLAEDPAPDPLFDMLAERLPKARVEAIDPATAAEAASDGGCTTVIWAGGPDAGAAAARALRPAGVTFIGADRLLDPDFLSGAGAEAEGSFALCACSTVSTSTDLAARRFIQDYQSQHGVAPGAYAVEAWDAAHLILRALDGGQTTRSQVARSLEQVTEVRGLDGAHGLRADGEPLEPRALLRLYVVRGGRWVPADWHEV
ncbi:MAG TPA: ABC transporter substrate-binding protein [Actinomycetota bacterium]|nr:ABC transporter substrate-binding protein [Actinomycetota bacterium]